MLNKNRFFKKFNFILFIKMEEKSKSYNVQIGTTCCTIPIYLAFLITDIVMLIMNTSDEQIFQIWLIINIVIWSINIIVSVIPSENNNVMCLKILTTFIHFGIVLWGFAIIIQYNGYNESLYKLLISNVVVELFIVMINMMVLFILFCFLCVYCTKEVSDYVQI